VAQYKTWRWTQWCMLFLAVFVYAIALPMDETYKPIVLKKRAKKHGIATKQETPDLKSEILMRFIRPLHLISTEVSFNSCLPSFNLRLTLRSL
jgi:hypothetical protein